MAGDITIRDRIDWHIQMAADLELSHRSFRVGVWIGKHLNNRTARSFVGYDRIAQDLGIARSTTAAAVAELRQRGHLEVESGGGRHVANEYRMILKTVRDVGRNSDDKTVRNQPLNRPKFRTTTLSFPTGRNSTGAKRRTPNKTNRCKADSRGEQEAAVFAKGSPQWDAWLAHYKLRDPTRARFMRSQRDVGGPNWSEPSEWPSGYTDNVATLRGRV